MNESHTLDSSVTYRVESSYFNDRIRALGAQKQAYKDLMAGLEREILALKKERDKPKN